MPTNSSETWIRQTFLPCLCRQLECLQANDAMREATASGKRLRPRLLWLVAQALHPDARDEREEEVLATAAVALECVHAYSLVHDDLPAMDDDALRRGKPTIHVTYGEAEGVLCGDALLTGAFEMLFTLAATSDVSCQERIVQAGQVLATAAGSRGMIGGQRLDMSLEEADAASTEQMVAQKTGALFAAAAEIGAILVSASDENRRRAKSLGETFGLWYQLVDDAADVEKDAQKDKWTWALALGDRREATMNRLGDEVLDFAQEMGMDELVAYVAQVSRDRRRT